MNSREKYSRLLGLIIDKAVEYRKLQDPEGSSKKHVENDLVSIIGVKEVSIIHHYKSPKKTAILKKNVDKVAKFAVEEAQLQRGDVEEFLKLAVDLECFKGDINVLLAELFPGEPALDKANSKEETEMVDIGVYNNLSAPTYSKYVMRDEFKQVMSLLSESRRPIILIKSMGGNGKTSLAREIASKCLEQNYEKSKFKVIVWISDKSKNGETNLNKVLDDIARVTGYDFSSHPLENKKENIVKILREKNALLIIDNYETIIDQSILEWLADILPEKCKCIITSRKNLSGFPEKIDVVNMNGLKKEEARSLIVDIWKTLGVEEIDNIADFDILIDKFQGSPKAIIMALGIICEKGLTLKESIDELIKDNGDLFQELFQKAWSVLDDTSKEILKIMSLFPNGTTKEAIIEILRISESDFREGVSTLNRLSFINYGRNTRLTESYYFIDSLTAAFAITKLEEDKEKESKQQKWMDYYTKLSEKIKCCRDESNTEDLSILDAYGLKDGFIYVINWAHSNGKHDFVITVSKNIKYYYYIRGFWSSPINLLRASSAEKISNITEEFDAYVYHFNILCKQQNTKDIQGVKLRLDILLDEHKDELPKISLIKYRHACALYFQMIGENDQAISIWEDNIKDEHISKSQLDVNERWLGIAYFRKSKYVSAQKYLYSYVEKLKDPNCKSIHSSLSAAVYLYRIYLENGNHENLLDKIDFALEKAKATGDYLYVAEFEYLMAKYHNKMGNGELSQKYYNDTLISFERIGCFDKVELIRKEI